VKRQWIPIVFLSLVVLAAFVAAQEKAKDNVSPAPADPALTMTKHTVKIGGQVIPYSATVGELVINTPDEKPGAKIFFTAYIRSDIRDLTSRPVTFCYNGGPGSSSVWLHMGGIGPRRVRMEEDGTSVSPPYGLEENPYSLLDTTDLVFIDPVSTGFSRPLPGETKSQFHGINEDISSVGEFIRLYVTRFNRWPSPKFLLGESYGTFRSAGLSGYLQNRQNGMFLNGIVLISSVLDFQTIRFSSHHNLPYILFLPHYSATAWYHKKLPAEYLSKPVREVVEEARRFASEEYSEVLFKGNRLSLEEVEKAAEKLAALTGLSLGYVKSANLRIRHDRFVKELLRDRGRTVGRLDSRFLGRDEDSAGEGYEFDPSSANIQGAFSTVWKDYVRNELGFDRNGAYRIYGNVQPWNYNVSQGGRMRFGSMVPSTADTLRRAMSENPHLRVFVANGYYDGATPLYGTEYTFSQMGLNAEFKDRVSMSYYEAGHMMYINLPCLKKFKNDVAGFIESASGK
jgi:carboxypeptidase C (cathepsin A)